MRIRRALIPAILTLGVAGSVLAGSATSVAAAHAPSAQVQAAGSSQSTHYHG